MSTLDIIKQIDNEISKLQMAKAYLDGNFTAQRSVGSPRKADHGKNAKAVKSISRVMSPEGRARVAAAQRARWAKVKKAEKNPPTSIGAIPALLRRNEAV